MSPSYWGPNTWIFMHTLACKIKEDSFPIIGKQLVLYLIQISYNLPCPECSQHAKQFWSNVNVNNVTKKQDIINILYVFHNSVNRRKKMPMFKYDNLNIYEEKSLAITYNMFSKTFNTHGNMKLLNESFHRNRLLLSLRKWLTTNLYHFNQ